MFQHILIPTDLTDRTAGTIDTLNGLVGDRSLQVTLLHVIEQIPETNLDEFREFYAGLEKRSATKLAALASRFGEPGIDIAQEVVYGHPAAAIAQFAAANQVDLIATLSYKIAMLAACPVLLVK